MPEVIDLRGVPCPLSWAKAKVRLETLPAGTDVEILLDDPKGARDLPRAAEAQGYHVGDVVSAGAVWRVLVEV